MESVQEVSNFFIEPYISVNNSEKKRVGIDLRPKHFLNDLCFSSFSKTDFILSSKKLSLCFLDGVRETILDKAFLFLGMRDCQQT
jgi:hypothetical protein